MSYFSHSGANVPGSESSRERKFQLPFDAPSRGPPCDINAIYTSLKSRFSGQQFRRWQYGSIFIRLPLIATERREISRNSKRIWPYSSSRSSKVIDLAVNGKPI